MKFSGHSFPINAFLFLLKTGSINRILGRLVPKAKLLESTIEAFLLSDKRLELSVLRT